MLDPTIRYTAAQPSDAPAIADLLEPYAEMGVVLPRPAGEIGEHIGNFLVAREVGEVLGAVALRDFGDGLHEVRSLVVDSGCVGRGVGSQLIKAAVDLAIARAARSVFTLTLRPGLFQRAGFELVDMERFPQKVWSDCAQCRKRHCCDEVALLLSLEP
ncbi:MAG: GNAT family N-acetyltransferase [Lentisphaerae bacterium]|jgi:amino-acid N-acetyltransferase|nr:GNAT family N-acetyltransferase [Lentisphaerota bacterium]MBT4814410.1 GNAT family N-acetyltransferase [Lentisphaerota bacterium]MBT5606299.1 GNAT family N-acetyltransferase [Lentisphaerota bacterium]MBT7059361.1 GNAT family N-acetyltransferase [Lentisphaerota bacterium]MBT7848256.1 GNAT family N-acetyltransferase [Lentisphaerota bacterium]